MRSQNFILQKNDISHPSVINREVVNNEHHLSQNTAQTEISANYSINNCNINNIDIVKKNAREKKLPQ